MAQVLRFGTARPKLTPQPKSGWALDRAHPLYEGLEEVFTFRGGAAFLWRGGTRWTNFTLSNTGTTSTRTARVGLGWNEDGGQARLLSPVTKTRSGAMGFAAVFTPRASSTSDRFVRTSEGSFLSFRILDNNPSGSVRAQAYRAGNSLQWTSDLGMTLTYGHTYCVYLRQGDTDTTNVPDLAIFCDMATGEILSESPTATNANWNTSQQTDIEWGTDASSETTLHAVFIWSDPSGGSDVYLRPWVRDPWSLWRRKQPSYWPESAAAPGGTHPVGPLSHPLGGAFAGALG